MAKKYYKYEKRISIRSIGIFIVLVFLVLISIDGIHSYHLICDPMNQSETIQLFGLLNKNCLPKSMESNSTRCAFQKNKKTHLDVN